MLLWGIDIFIFISFEFTGLKSSADPILIHLIPYHVHMPNPLLNFFLLHFLFCDSISAWLRVITRQFDIVLSHFRILGGSVSIVEVYGKSKSYFEWIIRV